MSPLAIICWAILLGGVAFVYVSKYIGKKKYEGVDMPVDTGWYEKSLSMYPEDSSLHQFFFHHDKHFSCSGHLMEDKSHNVVYEAKFLYNNVTKPDEVDFVNHIIHFNHHHKIGHTVTSSVGGGSVSAVVNSYFSFDGTNIWDYLSNRGYSHRFEVIGLAYMVHVSKNGEPVGTIYSSNNGKNFFEADGPIVPKMGGTGLCIIECRYKDLDALFLYAMAYARTELSMKYVK